MRNVITNMYINVFPFAIRQVNGIANYLSAAIVRQNLNNSTLTSSGVPSPVPYPYEHI